MSDQPTALRLFTHQLLDCDGKPNGVHVGCDDLEICKKSYIEGETSPAIHEWVDAAELRRLHEEITALRAAVVAVRFQCEADSKAGEWTTPISKVLELIDVMKGDKA
jgi:hypothetical protein